MDRILAKSVRSMENHKKKESLLKIGELAKAVGETVPTIRYWTKLGLLTVKDYTDGGYQLYDSSMVTRAKEIRRLQKEERLSLEEIKERVNRGLV